MVLVNLMKTFQNTTSAHTGIGDCAKGYLHHCKEQLPAIRDKHLIEVLKMEMDTWELVESLNRFELLAEGKFREVDETCWDGLEDCSSEAVFVDKLREKNALLRRAHVVVEWLEKRAASEFGEQVARRV